MIDFFSRLPNWSNSPSDELEFIDQLKTLLTEMDDRVNNSIVDVVKLESATEPTQGDWETAYTTQTGNSLPIPPSTVLQWWDTTNGRFGGEYGTILNDTAVYPRVSRNSPGSVHYINSNSKHHLPAHTIDYDLGENKDVNVYPSLGPVITVPCVFIISVFGYYTLNSGTGTVGLDVLINDVRYGLSYANLAADRGLLEYEESNPISLSLQTPTLPPGSYTIQPIMGRTNSTIPSGELNTYMHLAVRGVVP